MSRTQREILPNSAVFNEGTKGKKVQLSPVQFPLLGKSIFIYLFFYIYWECFLSLSQLYLKHPFVYF